MNEAVGFEARPLPFSFFFLATDFVAKEATGGGGSLGVEKMLLLIRGLKGSRFKSRKMLFLSGAKTWRFFGLGVSS